MADEEMALPNSSGDDYDEDPQEKKAAQGKDAPKEPAKPKKARYTLFDFLLMLAFATLIVAMMYLKYHEEMFAKEQYKFESTVRADNYYKELGVEPGASTAEIKRKYRDLAKIWHPDKNPGCKECKEKFAKLVEAHETLTDETKRGNYDSKIGLTKTFRSQTETVTADNYEELVVNSNSLWLIQIYDPTTEGSEKAAPLWEEFYKEWKGVVHFGRVDATREPKVLERFPFTIRIFPSIVSYAPTGDYDLLSLNAAFNPTEIKRALKELLSKAVDYVDANEAVRFLQLAPEYYDPRSISKFNVLLLPKKQNVPFDYLKYGMNNMGVLNLGVVPHDQRTGVLKMLKTDQHKNMLISYKKYNANGEPSHTMESAEVSVAEMTSILTLTVRHSIVEMYKNNYRHYCFFPIAKEDDERASRSSSQSEDEEESQEQQGTKEETKEEDRLVCVLALLDGSLDEADRLKNFQRYVHMRYAEGYARPTKDRAAVSHTQYGTIRLGWHPELQKLILQTQQSFKLERSRLNYLLISAENDAYSIIAPMNSKELQLAIRNFATDAAGLRKDYLSNYRTKMANLLSRDDDTLLRALLGMLKSMYTIISAVVAAIGAYALCKYTKWNYFNTFAGLVIAAYAMQVARFLFVNYAHFFGRFH